jgi:hypothetical protein
MKKAEGKQSNSKRGRRTIIMKEEKKIQEKETG